MVQLCGRIGRIAEPGSGGSPVSAAWHRPSGGAAAMIDSEAVAPLIAPKLALMVVVPRPLAVARPELPTDATVESCEVHEAKAVRSCLEPSE